jgi:NAD(P)-dependent dehydrogenase (short-subunit alcohol dehydrogenase family)
MEIRLDGRVALVTGGSAGLGLAMACRFAASGASVGIVARRPDVLEAAAEQVRTAGADALPTGGTSAPVAAVTADVRDPAQLEAAHRSVVERLGPVDILVNNAGTSAAQPFAAVSDDAWQADFDLKLFAAIRLIRLVLPEMRARRWGRIINVLNTGAKAPNPGGTPTVVTRAAGMALTKALAGEVAADNVLVNALCTGLLVSEQWERRHAATAGETTFDEFVVSMGRRVPLGRMGNPEEFANLACFLASDAASYLTGTAINVDGGLCPVV